MPLTIPRLTASLLAGEENLPLLVVLPSLGTAAAVLWRETAELLASRFRVLAVDLPGHGASPAASGDLTMASLAEGVRRAVAPFAAGQPFLCAGVSIGGAITLQLAHESPALLSGAIVLNSAAKIGTSEAWTGRAALVQREGTPALRAGSEARWFAPGFAPCPRSEALLASLEAADPASYAALCGALALFDLREALPATDLPMLVIGGIKDQATPPADQQAIAALVPGARAAILENVAHLAPAEQPEAVAALIAAFQG